MVWYAFLLTVAHVTFLGENPAAALDTGLRFSGLRPCVQGVRFSFRKGWNSMCYGRRLRAFGFCGFGSRQSRPHSASTELSSHSVNKCGPRIDR